MKRGGSGPQQLFQRWYIHFGGGCTEKVALSAGQCNCVASTAKWERKRESKPLKMIQQRRGTGRGGAVDFGGGGRRYKEVTPSPRHAPSWCRRQCGARAALRLADRPHGFRGTLPDPKMPHKECRSKVMWLRATVSYFFRLQTRMSWTALVGSRCFVATQRPRHKSGQCFGPGLREALEAAVAPERCDSPYMKRKYIRKWP